MRRNERGFTLVELLAVIVILGLLMAIAIPSVTKYITQSRKKTLISSIDSYVTAVTTAVNDNEFGAMSKEDTIYYVPVSNNESNSCVSLEKGGSDPFGNWKEAYVVVSYDSDKYSYDYYFTFYDDAGYGMSLTEISKIDANSNIITNPSPVNSSNITTQKNDRATYVKVLKSSSCKVDTAVDGGSDVSNDDGQGENKITSGGDGKTYNTCSETNSLISGKCRVTSGSGTNVGDVITCGSESFYVVPNHPDAGSNTISMMAKNTLTLTTDKPFQSSCHPETTKEDAILYIEAYSKSFEAMGITGVKTVMPVLNMVTCTYTNMTVNGSTLQANTCESTYPWVYSESFHTETGWIYATSNSPYHAYLPFYFSLDEIKTMLPSMNFLYGVGARPVVIIPKNQVEFK